MPMVGNYTPIDIEKLKDKNSSLDTILLLIAIVTLLVLAVTLFLLIQKKIKETQLNNVQNENVSTKTPTLTLTPTLLPENQPTMLPAEAITETPVNATESSSLNQQNQLNPPIETPSTQSSQINQNAP